MSILEQTSVAVSPEIVEAFRGIAQWAAGAILGMAAVFGVIMRWFMLQIGRRDDTNAEALKASSEAIKALDASNKTNMMAVQRFHEAIEAWRSFEYEERSTHATLVQASAQSAKTLEGVASTLSNIERDMRATHRN